MKTKKLLLLIALISLVSLVLFFLKTTPLGDTLTLDYLKSKHSQLQIYFSNNPFQTLALFFLLYVLATALSIPGATLLTLAAGAIFGLIPGLILVSFASTSGATVAFLISRTLLRDLIQRFFPKPLKKINQGIKKDGPFYLFAIRLVPLFPFFLVNLCFGLTTLKARSFFFISQLGMLPGTFAYVNAGTQLASINSLQDILSPRVLLSFALLGLLPFVCKKLLNLYAKKH